MKGRRAFVFDVDPSAHVAPPRRSGGDGWFDDPGRTRVLVNNGDLESALRRLKRIAAGVFREVKAHESFISPGARRRAKARAAMRRVANAARRKGRQENP